MRFLLLGAILVVSATSFGGTCWEDSVFTWSGGDWVIACGADDCPGASVCKVVRVREYDQNGQLVGEARFCACDTTNAQNWTAFIMAECVPWIYDNGETKSVTCGVAMQACGLQGECVENHQSDPVISFKCDCN